VDNCAPSDMASKAPWLGFFQQKRLLHMSPHRAVDSVTDHLPLGRGSYQN
jgi:hypothetical protein